MLPHAPEPDVADPRALRMPQVPQGLRDFLEELRLPALTLSLGCVYRDERYPDHGQGAMAGVRPLPYSPRNPLAAVTRRHILHDHRNDGVQGMISLIGGKLTTAGSVARECARKIGIDVSEPRHEVLVNSLNLHSLLAKDAAAVDPAISPDAATAVKSWFGRSAREILRSAAAEDRFRTRICDESSHIVAEAVYAMNNECAVTLADALLRRVPVALSGTWSEQQTRQAAERIGSALGWSKARIQSEVEQFEEERQSFLVKARAATTA